MPLLIETLVLIAVAYSLLRLAHWIGGPKIAVVIGVLILGFLSYAVVNIQMACNAEPTYVPPECDDEARCGVGMMIFPCDAPGGALIYGFAWYVAPLTALITAYLTFRVASRSQRIKPEA